MRVTLIAMMGANGVIGRGGLVPWHLAEDMARFKALTMGHPVLMGRKTWETLEGPLPGRENVVITRRREYEAPGARIEADLMAALLPYRGTGEEVWVVGGGEIFSEALPLADRLVLTVVEESPEGDAFFPELPPGRFCEVSREARAGPPPHAFVVLERAVTAGDGGAGEPG